MLNFRFFHIIVLASSLLLLNACKKEGSNINNSANPLAQKKYNEVCFLTTHNAFNAKENYYLLPNQDYGITRQLADGVRGLMIDAYEGTSQALVYHGVSIGGNQFLTEVLDEIKTFLDNNTQEVVSIVFENYCPLEQLINAIDDAGLDQYLYTHNGTWQTLQQMIDNNQRLVIYVEYGYDSESQPAWMMNAYDIMFDTHFEYEKLSDFNCNIFRGRSGSKELFLVNHWLSNGGLPNKSKAHVANQYDIVKKRIDSCSVEQNHFVNFLAVDFYNIGEAKRVVDEVNGL
ncbi:MAG: phosphatidylinositol-specific phospholipase C domain-containing protein [Chitinophagales bacterium]|nr:phosphatidylinositol-specific phospholipase C domain-containing protein [Chitinophagales bacterium]